MKLDLTSEQAQAREPAGFFCARAQLGDRDHRQCSVQNWEGRSARPADGKVSEAGQTFDRMLTARRARQRVGSTWWLNPRLVDPTHDRPRETARTTPSPDGGPLQQVHRSCRASTGNRHTPDTERYASTPLADGDRRGFDAEMRTKAREALGNSDSQGD